MDLIHISQLDIATRMLVYDLNRMQALIPGPGNADANELARKMIALSVAIKTHEPVIGRYIDYFA